MDQYIFKVVIIKLKFGEHRKTLYATYNNNFGPPAKQPEVRRCEFQRR